MDYPVRNEQHEIGDAAVRRFKYIIPSRWLVNDAGQSDDYGWDHLVAVSDQATKEVRDEFYVQVKGSRSPSYSADRSFVSVELKVTTANFLLVRPMPPMVVFCNVADPGEPVLWTWITDAIADVEARNPLWRSQSTVTIRVPASQTLPNDCAEIERHVRDETATRRVAAVVYDVIVPVPRRHGLRLPDPIQIDAAFVQRHVMPLADAGVIRADLSTDPRSDTLGRISALLGVFQDAKAESLLEEVGDLADAALHLQASAANSRGILWLRKGEFAKAAPYFRMSTELDSSQAKYSVNLLLVESLIHPPEALPTGWHDRLIDVATAHPEYAPGVRLRLGVIAEREGLKQAEDFARSTVAFQKDQRTLLVALAEAARHLGEFSQALRYIETAEKLPGDTDAELQSLKGFLLFRTALPSSIPEVDGHIRFEGLGPSQLDIERLQRAADALKKACETLTQQGFPLLTEDTFVNAANALVLAQRAPEARVICEGFLSRHPAAHQVQLALAMVLTHLDRPSEGIRHAHEAFIRSEGASEFKSLLLALMAAEEHTEVVRLVSKREQTGFTSIEEQALSLELSALALWHLGESDKMKAVLDTLRSLGDEPAADAATVEILIAKRERRPIHSVIEQARAALNAHPDNAHLLNALLRVMLPVTYDNATELVEIVHHIARARQLGPEEAAVLGDALSTLGRHEEAEQTFGAALRRFPQEIDFMVGRAQELHALGRDEDSFQQLQEFIRLGKRSYSVYRNLGHLARTTGRLDEAIQLFESALKRADKAEDVGELHCLLFELRRRRGDSPRARMRHVVEYGRVTSGEPDDEARYLMMFMVTPLTDEDRNDPEVQKWITEYQQRQARFSTEHPTFQSLVTFKAPEGLSEEATARHLISEVMAYLLPGQLLRGQFLMRIREGAWPLSFRASHVISRSFFDYFDYCTYSNEPEHAIHIFSAPISIDDETALVPLHESVCVDITALATLHHLGLLDSILGVDYTFVVATATRDTVEHDDAGPTLSHRIAVDLREWLIRNRSRIRIRRSIRGGRDADEADSHHKVSGVWVPRRPTITETLGDGVGETLMLAEELGLPLYSDEVSVRQWAGERGVRAFSTIALLRRLRGEQRLAIADETAVLARMMESNFRYVPVGAEHFDAALSSLMQKSQETGLATMNADPVLGPLLGMFGEMNYTNDSLLNVAIGWWMMLLGRPDLSDSVIENIVGTICFRFQQRAGEGVLRGPSPKKPAAILSEVAAHLLFAVLRNRPALIGRCWWVVRHVVEGLVPEESKAIEILQSLIGERFYRLLKKHRGSQLANDLLTVAEALPEPERSAWQRLLLKRAQRDGLLY